MKRKIPALILTAVMLTSTAVSAFDTKVEGNTVNITLNDEAFERKILMLVKAGADISDNADVYAIKESVADEDGVLSFTFNMKDEKNGESTNGEYDIYIRNNGAVEKTGSMFYATPESKTDLIQALEASKSAEDTGAVLNNEDNRIILMSVGFDMDAYESLEGDKDEVCRLMYDFGGEDFEKSFRLAMAVTNINDDNDVAGQLEKANLAFENKDYISITDSNRKKFIVEYIDSDEYDSIDGFCKAFEQANMLYVINNTRYDDMTDVLEEYAESLGIDDSFAYEDYLDLGKKEKTKVNEKLAEKLRKSPAKTTDSLVSKIDDAIEESEDKRTSSTAGGGGGGGSSRPSNAVAVGAVPSTDEKPVEENPTEVKPIFTDLADAPWASDAIKDMYERKIISGDGDGKCRPNDAIKREEFIKMLVLSLGIYDELAECDFSDIPRYSWYYRYVASAYNAGLINGVSETAFGAGEYLTRQDMAIICARSAEGRVSVESKRDYDGFADADSISDYARDAVSLLYRAEVINGMDGNCFEPFGIATRAQSAVMIYNLFK